MDERHKLIMKENRERRKRIEEVAKRKEAEKAVKEMEVLGSRKKEQKEIYEKIFKPNNNNLDKIERSLRYELFNTAEVVI